VHVRVCAGVCGIKPCAQWTKY